MYHRITREAIAACAWLAPTILLGMFVAGGKTTSTQTANAERSTTPIGVEEPIKMRQQVPTPLPKVERQQSPQSATKLAQPEALQLPGSIAPQPTFQRPTRNPIEGELRETQTLTPSQQVEVLKQYSEAHTKGMIQLRLSNVDGIPQNALGKHFLVRTNQGNMMLDRNGHLSTPLSNSNTSGLSIPLDQRSVPDRVVDWATSYGGSLGAIKPEVNLVLAPVVEIELYRSLYEMLSRSGQQQPQENHLYVASLRWNGSLIADWRDHGLQSVKPDSSVKSGLINN